MLQMMRGARHRGRLLISGGLLAQSESDAEFAYRMFRDLGLGPHVSIWAGGPEYLPADWPEQGKSDDTTWPVRQVWFEVDWFGDGPPPPVEDPDFWNNMAKLQRAWRILDIAPYCWANDAALPAGMAYCPGISPPGPQPPGPGPNPPGPQPPGPGPQPPDPGPEPAKRPGSSAWVVPVLGIVIGATMIGGVAYAYRSR